MCQSDENPRYSPVSIKDEPVAHVHDFVRTERELSICEKDEYGISYDPCQTI